MIRNYLFGWIENLGVDPLFLFAAFLFLPVFEAFLLRMAFVCLVFDAIRLPHLFRRLRFHKILCFVKALPLCFFISPCVASSPSNLYLSKGEQITIPAIGLKQFSVGNPEVLGRRYSPRAKKIYLKGKKMGYSDVILWGKNGRKTYHAYVISKSQNLKLAQAANTFKGLGLDTFFEGKKVWAKGLLKNLGQLKRLLQVKSDYPKQVELDLELTPELELEIISKAYLLFHQKNISQYFCRRTESFPRCEYQAIRADQDLEKTILEQWGVTVSHHEDILSSQNLKVEFKFLEIETQEREDFSLGFSKLNSTVRDYLNQESSLYLDNLIQLNGSEHKMKIIAEPQVQSILNQKNKIQIGLNIPFQTTSRDGFPITEWIETGLKVNFELTPHQNRVLLKYESELSAPSTNQIKTNEQSGSFFPEVGKSFSQIFQIGLEATRKEHNGPLILKDLPLIGSLLKSHSHLNTYKVFLGFVKVSYE